MGVRRSGAGGVTTHPRLLLDKDLPESSAVPQDACCRNYAMNVPNTARNERSGDESRRHFTQTRRDLETEFERRHSVLQQGCKQHDAKVTLPHMWRMAYEPVLPGPLTLCIIFKVSRTIPLEGMLEGIQTNGFSDCAVPTRFSEIHLTVT